MVFGARFLRFPALFPRRIAGEHWGENGLEIDFAGGPYRFIGLATNQLDLLQERFAGLCRPPRSPAALELEFFRVDQAEFLPLDLGSSWLYTFDRECQPDAVALAGVDFMARLEWQGQERRLKAALFTGRSSGAELQCLVENVFRVLVAYRLLELGGVLLHSAGIVSRGRAHLFLGSSGAGKSTISRLSLKRGRAVLSDDINALALDAEGRPIVQMLPFAGDLGRSAEAESMAPPLAALYRLRQGATQLDELSKARALALLLSCAPFVNDDPFRVELLSENLETLVKCFPTWQLSFDLEEDFWPTLDENAQTFTMENTR